jgi:hypothetical protein
MLLREARSPRVTLNWNRDELNDYDAFGGFLPECQIPIVRFYLRKYLNIREPSDMKASLLGNE